MIVYPLITKFMTIHQWKCLLSNISRNYTNSVLNHQYKINPFSNLKITTNAVTTMGPSPLHNQDVLLSNNELSIQQSNDSEFNISLQSHSNALFQLPHSCNLQVECHTDEPIIIERLECKNLHVQSKGPIHLTNIKANFVQALSETKIILGKVLNGDANLEVRNGIIETDRMQGSNFTLKALKGDIRIKSLYSQSLTIECNNGKINIGTALTNASIDVKTQGNVDIGNLDGGLNLSMKIGNVKCHFAGQETQADVSVAEGNIDVSFDSKASTVLDIKADEISLSDDLALDTTEIIEQPHGQRFVGTLNEPTLDGICKFQTNEGRISVSIKSWFDSVTQKST